MPAFLAPSICLAALLILLLFVVKAIFSGASPSSKNALLAVTALLLDCTCLAAGSLLDQRFGTLPFPWAGKACSLIGLGVLIKLAIKHRERGKLGLRAPVPGSTRASLVVFASLLTITLVTTYLSPFRQAFSLNALFFMAIVSGVDEELVFRGLMPYFLAREDAKGKNRRVNAVITLAIPTASFAIMHGWWYANGHFAFNPRTLIFTAIGACGFMYSRERSLSLLPAIVAHNLINTTSFVALCLK